MNILYNTDKMPVGKYKGVIIQEIIDKNPEYVRKFNENNIAFCDDIMLEVGRITSNTQTKPLKKFKSHQYSYNNVLNTKTS